MARTEVDEGSIGYPSHRSGSAQLACVKAGGDKPLAGAKWRCPGTELISPDETGMAEGPGDQGRSMYRANNNQRVLTHWEAATRTA